MRNTNRGTLGARAAAMVGSALLALALMASPGYAGPDRADRGHQRSHGLAGQIGLLGAMIAHKSLSQGAQVQASGSGDVECNGTLTGDFDSVTVPPGAVCILVNATVDGNVTAEEDSLLRVDNTLIRGNLEGDDYEAVQVFNDNRIRGNVRLQNGGPTATAFFEQLLCGNIINGNVSLQRSTGTIAIGGGVCDTNGGGNLVGGSVSVTDSLTNAPTEFHVDDNLVGANMTIDGNRGNGIKTVQDNLIGQTLSCRNNQNPFVGTPNDADRTRNQCAQ